MEITIKSCRPACCSLQHRFVAPILSKPLPSMSTDAEVAAAYDSGFEVAAVDTDKLFSQPHGDILRAMPRARPQSPERLLPWSTAAMPPHHRGVHHKTEEMSVMAHRQQRHKERVRRRRARKAERARIAKFHTSSSPSLNAAPSAPLLPPAMSVSFNDDRWLQRNQPGTGSRTGRSKGADAERMTLKCHILPDHPDNPFSVKVGRGQQSFKWLGLVATGLMNNVRSCSWYSCACVCARVCVCVCVCVCACVLAQHP